MLRGPGAWPSQFFPFQLWVTVLRRFHILFCINVSYLATVYYFLKSSWKLLFTLSLLHTFLTTWFGKLNFVIFTISSPISAVDLHLTLPSTLTNGRNYLLEGHEVVIRVLSNVPWKGLCWNAGCAHSRLAWSTVYRGWWKTAGVVASKFTWKCVGHHVYTARRGIWNFS